MNSIAIYSTNLTHIDAGQTAIIAFTSEPIIHPERGGMFHTCNPAIVINNPIYVRGQTTLEITNTHKLALTIPRPVATLVMFAEFKGRCRL